MSGLTCAANRSGSVFFVFFFLMIAFSLSSVQRVVGKKF